MYKDDGGSVTLEKTDVSSLERMFNDPKAPETEMGGNDPPKDGGNGRPEGGDGDDGSMDKRCITEDEKYII